MRVVVTGIGVISPVGAGRDEFWKNITGGVCGVDPVTRFDTAGHKASLAAEVKGFDPALYMDKKDYRRADLYCQYAVAASRLALEDGKVNPEDTDRARFGVIIGSGVGGLMTLEAEHSKLVEKGPRMVSPFFIPMMISNMASGVVSMAFGLRGVSYAPVSACATGANAIGEACNAIMRGELDFALAGGAEAAITPLAFAGFSNMTALSTASDPKLASLPFDRRRAGFVMGEGSGVLLLESYDSALRRGAEIYCEVLGYGATSDAHHVTSPDPEGRGASEAMRMACKNVEINTVSYINAHGTGTPANDKCETCAIKIVFGDNPPPTSSTKSMTGHLLGAAGGIEAAICALAVRDDIMPPTVNYLEPDPECDIDVVPLAARRSPVRRALSNSFGFGGHNASLLFGKVES